MDDRVGAFLRRYRESFALGHAVRGARTWGVSLKVRIYVTGEHSHDIDAIPPEFGTLGRGHAGQSELAGGIDGHPWQADFAGDGTDVHQSATGLPQPGQSELGERERREKIQFEDRTRLFERRGGSAVIGTPARVIDEGVDFSPAVHRSFHDGGTHRIHGDVAGNDQVFCRCHSREAAFRSGSQAQVRATRAQSGGEPCADPLRGPCDDDDLSLERIHPGVNPFGLV